MIELVTLDMAGTTVNEHGLVYKALADSVVERGFQVSEETLQQNMGTRKTTAISNLIVAAGGDASSDVVAQTYQRFTELLTEYYAQKPPTEIPGCSQAIAEMRARGLKVVLTTGFSADVATSLLAALDWRIDHDGGAARLDGLVTADTVPEGRPAPYMIFRAMEKTGVQNVQHVAVAGDTMADVLSGSNAGAGVVAGVLTGETPEALLREQPHTHILDSVASMPEIVTT